MRPSSVSQVMSEPLPDPHVERREDGSVPSDDGPSATVIGPPTTTPDRSSVREPERASGNLVVGGLAILVVATSAYFALGMPGMDHSSTTSMDGMAMNESTDLLPAQRIDADRFEEFVRLSATTVLNVHVPDAGAIEGTDLFIALDDLEPALLPSDRTTPLTVYCKSGTRSVIAVARLAELGYTDIVELDGGLDAWVASGRTLVDPT